MPNELLAEWGRNLKRLRKERKLSLREISDKAGISKTYYCYLEAGQHDPSTEVRIAVARTLGVRVEDIWVYPDPERKAS